MEASATAATPAVTAPHQLMVELVLRRPITRVSLIDQINHFILTLVVWKGPEAPEFSNTQH